MGRNGVLSKNCRHSRGYRNWIWFGERFTFSRGEARILREFVKAFRRRIRELEFREEVLKPAGSKAWNTKSIRFRNFFTTESGRRAFGRLIRKVEKTRGIYTLNVHINFPVRV